MSHACALAVCSKISFHVNGGAGGIRVVPQLQPAALTLFIRSKKARLNCWLPLFWAKLLVPASEIKINKQSNSIFFIQPYDAETQL